MPICACGCGKEISKRAKKYIYGHNRLRTAENAIKDNIKIDENGCWLWQKYKMKSGHGHVRFRNKTYLAHRFSYQYFKSEDIKNKIICHKCDRSDCVNPDHLYAGTQFDNIQDMVWKGSVNFDRMIPDEDIIKIREMYDTGKYKQYELAKMFEINRGYISRIVRNERRQTKLNVKSIENVFKGGGCHSDF